jgi:hypothetical protein
MVCDLDRLGEIHTNPRWKALREFRFIMDRSAQLNDTGRRAENRWRHQHSNYDAMLKQCGTDGLLWPEQFEQVRQGVDRLISSAMQTASKSSA